MKLLLNFARDIAGSTAAEYALIASLISSLVILGAMLTGDSIAVILRAAAWAMS